MEVSPHRVKEDNKMIPWTRVPPNILALLSGETPAYTDWFNVSFQGLSTLIPRALSANHQWRGELGA